jgi:anti-sigma factor RsiW
MSPDQQRLSEVDRSNLVAYLDGELGENEEQILATKLTQSISGRREMEALQRTWELLDFLPRPQASEGLSSRTLTEVRKLDLKGAVFVSAAVSVARHAAVVLVCAASVLVTLGLGYVSARWIWPDSTARLARELSIAEHLDEYQDAGSFEFLEMLDQSPAFNGVGQ